jgi:hypothetical protein
MTSYWNWLRNCNCDACGERFRKFKISPPDVLCHNCKTFTPISNYDSDSDAEPDWD